MNEVRRELVVLRARLRLLTMSLLGALAVGLMAVGGADAVAKGLVAAAPAWTIATRNLAGSASPIRLTVTGDEDVARIQITSANIELAQQGTTPPTTTAGALWYDSANGKLKYRNASTWVEPGGTAPLGASPAGVFGRLEITGTTSTTLDFKQYQGDYVDVNGEYVQIGAGKSLTSSTALLADNNGSSLSGTMDPSTTYCIYISNASASPAPSEIRAAPALTLGPVLYNGVKYLNSTGNGANWRFIGWARTNAAASPAQFEDSTTSRFVVNYYNRQKKVLMATPGLIDDNAFTSWALNSTTWSTPSTTPHKLEFVSNGEDAVDFHVQAAFAPVIAAGVYFGIAINTVTAVKASTMSSNIDATTSAAASYGEVFPVGNYIAYLVARVDHLYGAYVYSDLPAQAAPDPIKDAPATFILAHVWV